MNVLEYLQQEKVAFEISEHKPVFSAQRMAAAEHEPGRYVAKPVLVKVDGQMMMCVLDANHKVDLGLLKKYLQAKTVELATEEEVGTICAGCELGAEPPIGNFYDLPTIMDMTMAKDDHVLFQAGSHDKAVRISMADYNKLASPKIAPISYT